jgi:pimeloyl-ACP methyl ester carboxylesterase
MIKKGYVDTADGQIHYRRNETGSGEPIALFHMTASSSQSYDPLMRELSDQIPTIAFDTPNYGQSFKTSNEPTMAYIGTVLLEALDQLGIQKLHVLGHHTGASIAVETAVAAPARVLSATLSGRPP